MRGYSFVQRQPVADVAVRADPCHGSPAPVLTLSRRGTFNFSCHCSRGWLHGQRPTRIRPFYASGVCFSPLRITTARSGERFGHCLTPFVVAEAPATVALNCVTERFTVWERHVLAWQGQSAPRACRRGNGGFEPAFQRSIYLCKQYACPRKHCQQHVTRIIEKEIDTHRPKNKVEPDD